MSVISAVNSLIHYLKVEEATGAIVSTDWPIFNFIGCKVTCQFEAAIRQLTYSRPISA